MGFSRQEYWSGLPFPSPGDLLDPGIQLGSPALQADAFTLGATREVSEGDSRHLTVSGNLWQYGEGRLDSKGI